MSALDRIGTIVNGLLRWFHDLLRWLYALLGWLIREPCLFWFAALVLVIAVVVAFFWLRSEPAFRWIGLVLQILGIGTVVWNIRDTGARFDRPGTLTRAIQWWHGRPRFRSSTVVAVGTGLLDFVGSKPRVDIWHNAPADAAFEARLDAMEKNLSWVRDGLNEFRQETEKNLEQQTQALDQEKRARESDDKNIREKLEAAQIGGLHVSLMGVAWLFVGVIMSTIPSELARFANLLFP